MSKNNVFLLFIPAFFMLYLASNIGNSLLGGIGISLMILSAFLTIFSGKGK